MWFKFVFTYNCRVKSSGGVYFVNLTLKINWALDTYLLKKWNT